MNVCFVCGEYPPESHGGIGSLMQTLGRTMVRLGHTVRVVGVYPSMTRTSRETDQGVEVWRLAGPVGRWKGPRARRLLFQQIAAWARAGEIDIVEVPDYQGWAAFWPSLPVPVITRLNGSATYFSKEMGRRPRWRTAILERQSVRRSDFWCSVSRYTAERTKAIFGLTDGPHAVLPNPVAVALPTVWATRQASMAVFSGTLTEKKGVIPLIEAWRGVVRRFPQATLHMLGKDSVTPSRGSMMALLEMKLGDARPTVHFHGHVPREQVLEWLTRASVACLPSFAEAFAIAPLEAMAAGCPTIGSALGSGPELIAHDVDGLTVDPRHPAEIEAALCRVFSDPAAAYTLAERGRIKVEQHFRVDTLAEANLAFYRTCVAAHANAAPARPAQYVPADAHVLGGSDRAARGQRPRRE